MFERFMCGFVFQKNLRVEKTGVLGAELWEAYEWMEQACLELHLE